MRDLASVVTVATVGKMYQKDLIQVATFKENGYEVVVPKSVKVGDRLVFIQEGSILPVDERWEFLRKRCYNASVDGFVIKPMTLGAKDSNGEKGERVKSWGLAVTLEEAGLNPNLKAGTDVTDLLKIRKYESALDASPRKSKLPKFIRFCLKHKLLRWIARIYMSKPNTQSDFPIDIISKSDETTIQNYSKVIEQFPGKKAFITCKMEGQSATFSLDPKTNKFFVCSRNNRYNKRVQASEPFYKTAEIYDIENKLRAYKEETGIILVLQGEQCGPSIQNNIYNFENNRFFIYRMKGLVDKKWVEYPYDKMLEIAKHLGLELVPLFEVVEDMSKYNSVDSLVKLAETAYWTPNNFVLKNPQGKMWKNYLQHEGIVVKSIDYNKELGTGFSFKVKNIAYQEKELSEIAGIARNLK
jgi:hypothetical protein